LGNAYGLNTQVLLANLQHFCCNNNIIILNYYYFIPGLFASHSWWAESCNVRLNRGMVRSRQPRSFQDVDPHGRPDGWTEGGWRDARDGTHGVRGRNFLALIYIYIYIYNFFIFIPTNMDINRQSNTGLFMSMIFILIQIKFDIYVWRKVVCFV
jgi:hypothetical protein